MNIVIEPGEATAEAEQVIVNRAQQSLDFIRALVVDSPEAYSEAASEALAINRKIHALDEQKAGLVRPFNEGLKRVRAMFDRPTDLLGQAKKILADKMLQYQRDEAAKRQAEQSRLDAIAAQQRAAAAEAARQAQAAADEAQAEARRLQEAGDAAAAQAAEDRSEAMAQQAQATLTESAVITAPVVSKTVVKVSGISSAKTIDFEVENKIRLLTFIVTQSEKVVGGIDLTDLVTIDSKSMRAFMRISGLNTKLPGVRVFESETMRVARR
jgi:uncharacterized protein YhaN